MKQILQSLRSDKLGQDLIEYALMAAFVAVAAGTVPPGVVEDMRQIFLRLASTTVAAK